MADARSPQEAMYEELRRVAPGTLLRDALDMLISARAGALIVIGEPAVVEPLCDGGFAIDTPFTPQRVFELSKMDGAIVLDAECARILKANVHLVPDADLPTSETGMRHRTAERVSRQTSALTIAISQRRNVVSLYLQGERATLDDIDVLLAKANQSINTLQNYRDRLDEMLERLTLLEFEDLVTLGDLAEVIGRFEMLRRVQQVVSRHTMQLGDEGRLVRMQADELAAGVAEQYALVLRDYIDEPGPRRITTVRERLSALPSERLLEPATISHELGLSAADQAEQYIRPRGHRILAQIPQLPASVVSRVVERFGTLGELTKATAEDLDGVDGVGLRRAKAIAKGLERVRAHVTV